jgi:hypothetical protein
MGRSEGLTKIIIDPDSLYWAQGFAGRTPAR